MIGQMYWLLFCLTGSHQQQNAERERVLEVCMCVCVCVCVCVHVCMHACVRACMHVCVCLFSVLKPKQLLADSNKSLLWLKRSEYK